MGLVHKLQFSFAFPLRKGDPHEQNDKGDDCAECFPQGIDVGGDHGEILARALQRSLSTPVRSRTWRLQVVRVEPFSGRKDVVLGVAGVTGVVDWLADEEGWDARPLLSGGECDRQHPQGLPLCVRPFTLTRQ